MKIALRLGLVLSLFLSNEVLPNYAFAQTINISDTTIRPIEIAQMKSSARVVALANGSAEIVAALGLRAALVGRDIASTTPELSSVPIVTSGHQVIPEKILALKPTLILVDKNTGPASAIETLRKSHISVVTIPEAWQLSEVSKKILAIGSAIGEPRQARTLIAKLNSATASAKSQLGWRPRVAFLYLRGPSSIYLMGGPGSGADSIISALGGIDVGARRLKNPFNTLTAEALAQANPDVLLVMTKGLESVGGKAGLVELPGVMQTKAGKSARILAVDDSLLLSFGPRTPALLKAMSTALRAMK